MLTVSMEAVHNLKSRFLSSNMVRFSQRGPVHTISVVMCSVGV